MSMAFCKVPPTQSSQIVYTKTMKKTFVYSLIAALLIGAPAFAQTSADLTASATKDVTVKEKEPIVVKEVAPRPKSEPLAIRRQKIEKDLRATVIKLQTVIDRTQTLIDLLNKNEKDTTEANKLLVAAQTSLKEAIASLDIFSGVVIPEVKIDLKSAKMLSATSMAEEKPAPASLKDPLKKAEDALKESKANIIASINALKESLATKDSQ